jgi:hypothetical protein
MLGLSRPAVASPVISVDPGSLFGYIPLANFGVTPTPITPDGLLTFAVPSFTYAGETWSSVSAAENGFLIVGGGSGGAASPQSLPDPTAPNNVLAPFWRDLTIPGIRATTLTDGVNTWLVFDWAGAQLAGGSGLFSFEVWIGVDGFEDITFAYDPAHMPPVIAATIGAEDKTGHFGDMVPSVTGDLRVVTGGLPLDVPEPISLVLLGTGAAGFAARERRRRKV